MAYQVIKTTYSSAQPYAVIFDGSNRVHGRYATEKSANQRARRLNGLHKVAMRETSAMIDKLNNDATYQGGERFTADINKLHKIATQLANR